MKLTKEENYEEDEEEYYVITEQGCMQLALEEFGINVSTVMADAIKQRFMKLMINAGHIGVNEDVD